MPQQRDASIRQRQGNPSSPDPGPLLACLSLASFPQLENRVRSLPGSLVIEIHPPDHDARMSILRYKAELAGIDLPEDVIHLIARQERYTIRGMEGLVNRVTAYASLTGQPITSDLGYQCLRNVLTLDG